jgi:hypothetical protein
LFEKTIKNINERVKFENAILTGSLAKAKAKAKELKGKVYAVSVTATAIV